MPIKQPLIPDDLLAILAHLQTKDTIDQLLTDLLAASEINAVAERWAIVKRLAAGESQRHVRDAVGVSVATVSRGSKQLKYGTGGFAQAFQTLPQVGFVDPRDPE